MGEPVIVGAVRTPIGKRDGLLRRVRPEVLYAAAVDALVERNGLAPEWVDDVITGCVTQAGEQGMNVGRLAVLCSSLGERVPAVTLSRMCGSSQQAVHFAAQAIAAGDARLIIAGGVESMTRVPMFLDVGDLKNLSPAARAKYELVHQGESAERIAERYGISRRELDEFAYRSHVLAARATQEGRFRRHLVPVQGHDGEGRPVQVDYDEGIRFEPSLERMLQLPPAFRPDGRVTAGNSSQISDGAAAVLVADADFAQAHGLRARARFRARVVVAGDPTLQLMEVVPATRAALARAGLTLRDVDVIEINEAFASVVLGWARELEPDLERVNPNGGAIAHGHPLGATGAVLMAKLVDELERRDGQFGLQVMCIGHGMATATVLERVS